jgi:hypothetical protein
MMRFYNQPYRFYAGIDLHARSMYVCVLDQHGAVVLHRNLDATPTALLAALAPFRDGLVVGCECMFAWYWLADLCAEHDIPFVLGHALYLKGDPRRQEQERQARLAEARHPAARRHLRPGLRYC